MSTTTRVSNSEHKRLSKFLGEIKRDIWLLEQTKILYETDKSMRRGNNQIYNKLNNNKEN